jgi:hypothetical protein
LPDLVTGVYPLDLATGVYPLDFEFLVGAFEVGLCGFVTGPELADRDGLETLAGLEELLDILGFDELLLPPRRA